MDSNAEVPPVPLSSADRLDSWKAIAAFFSRDIRTVQRYEAEGLPVYRRQNAKHGSVYAYRSELDKWLTSRESAIRQERAKPTRSSYNLQPRRYLRPAIYVAVGIVITLSVLTARQLLFGDDQPSAGPAIQSSTIAVLPFGDVSPIPSGHNLARDFSQRVLTNLRLQSSFHVVDSSGPAQQFSNASDLSHIANTLHADQLLSGTISHDGQSIRITAELTNVRNGKLLWSTQYETESDDPAVFESGVARAVALGVKNALSVSSPIEHVRKK